MIICPEKIVVFCFIIASYSSCGQTSDVSKPLKMFLNDAHNSTNLTKYLNKKSWADLFPNRYHIRPEDSVKTQPDFYSFDNFVAAAKLFPSFLADGEELIQKRELAAFLANIAQETSGGWPTAPGGYFKWGLYFLEEQRIDTTLSYSDTSKKNYPPIPGKYYFGRGPKQLSWNYNYGQFSEAWYGSKDTLLQKPELISSDPVLCFASAIWFWMTTQLPKPSCHDIITGKWQPTHDDILDGRFPGFGATVNVINGGIECGTGIAQPKTKYRYAYYKFFCEYLQVDAGVNITCNNQKPFGQLRTKY